jgi:site-specific DNA-adenine methylase
MQQKTYFCQVVALTNNKTFIYAYTKEIIKMDALKAPFPYFGGKSTIANIVWQLLGEPKSYIEPFFGSGAVLLLRPNYNPMSRMEIVCDKDGYVANVWRAIQFDHAEVAKWCDWPVNHVDLCARRKELIKNERRLLDNLIDDPEWYDPKLAGYWIWAASCWIGSGLTYNKVEKCKTNLEKRPHITNTGTGVHKISIGQIPHIANTGTGVHKISIGQIPHISNTGSQIHQSNTNIYDWLHNLSDRLRRVRVVCGDWSKVCSGNWLDNNGDVGIFFDPPYGEKANRKKGLYHCDNLSVADDVRVWCVDQGKKKSHKIVLAGYFEEHKLLLDHGWKSYAWTAQGGYSNKGKNDNRKKETLFYSPHCLSLNETKQEELF